MSLNLVPLRIPTGWKVNLNDFTESFPDRFTDDNYEHRWEFKEDIMKLESNYKKRVIDLGWYPEFDADGQYTLMLVDVSEENGEGSFYWNKLIEYRSRSIEEIRMKIEEFLRM